MLKGDTSPWRTFGDHAIYDPLAAIEDPSSKVFQSTLLEEKTLWNTCLSKQVGVAAVASWKKLFQTSMKAALPPYSDFAQTTLLWGVRIVKIQHTFGHRLNVWVDDILYDGLSFFSYDPESSCFLTIQDVGSGSESLELAVYTIDDDSKARLCFKKHPVGPSAFFHGAKVYYQNVENALRYPAVLCVDKDDGRNEHCIYENKDKRFQVELLKPAKQPDVFVKIANALSQRIGVVSCSCIGGGSSSSSSSSKGVEWLTPVPPPHGTGNTWIPLREDLLFSNSYLVYKDRKYTYPGKTFIKECVLGSMNNALLVTIKKGVCRLYSFDMTTASFHVLYDGKKPQVIHLYESTIPSVSISKPYTSTCLYEVEESSLVFLRRFPEPLKLSHTGSGFATSKDGTRVPYTIVSHVKYPRKLIVEAYGAYGICANPSYPIHWLPYLAKGYAYALAMPRGGRDDGDAWYDGGRTALKKHHTFEDTAAVISAVQKRLAICAKKTFFYGRSAGGWLAAAIGLQYPEKIGAIYAEVPYLDVLRTTSNPALPLTQLEYDEFGDPIKRPEEFKALQRISPIDSLTLAPQKAPFFLLRTGLHDVQVLPYEVLKFAKKARGLGWNVVVGVDEDGGHFAAEDAMAQQQAEDAALLDACLTSSISSKHQTRKLRSHKPRSKTLRRKSSWKI